MKRGYLSDYFTGVGTKTLTCVDATPKSNQHEIGDKNRGDALKKVLGDVPRKQGNRFNAQYIWLGDEQETITGAGYLSWYNTRENQKQRAPEWRLYYQGNAVTELMDEGDRIFIARQPDDTILFIVVPNKSSITSQLAWLFGLDVSLFDEGFTAQDISPKNDTRLDFAARFILDEIGIEYEDPDANTLDSIIERFGMVFPKTKEFSDLARLTLKDVDARDDPDAALIAWLDHEEAMFRRLENRIVAKDLKVGWVENDHADVDAFVKYSLGVQNRRKSRMGRSFENHLKAVFDSSDIRYGAQITTEKGKKPDFIFPGAEEYSDPSFNVNLLTMLAAKSSCKDRWSQVLPEAERLDTKHLITLEPGISEPQTETMMRSGVQLIVPGRIKESYTRNQQGWVWSLQDFVDLVSARQA